MSAPVNPIAARISQASLMFDDTCFPEIADALRIASNEIERLDRIVRQVHQPALDAAPSLVGKSAVVLYFDSDADRAGFMELVHEVKPNWRSVAL